MNRKSFITAAVLAVLLIVSIAVAQQLLPQAANGQIPNPVTLDVNNRAPLLGDFITYTPAQLNMSSVTLPASLPTRNSTVINMARAVKITVMGNCDQIWSLRVNVYDETGANVLNSYDIVTAIPASAWHQVFIASELAQNATAGTTPASPVFRLPQRVISFAQLNTTATPGTCNMRAVVGY